MRNSTYDIISSKILIILKQFTEGSYWVSVDSLCCHLWIIVMKFEALLQPKEIDWICQYKMIIKKKKSVIPIMLLMTIHRHKA